MRTLTLVELADEARAPIDLVEWLVELGQVRPLPDGRFDPRDAALGRLRRWRGGGPGA